ncbi:hypothetical protein [Streptomyces sp. NPDC054829]
MQEAEARFNAAAAELRRHQSEPEQWSGFESLTSDGKKHLNLHSATFDRREALEQQVERRRQEMLTIRRQWLEGR